MTTCRKLFARPVYSRWNSVLCFDRIVLTLRVCYPVISPIIDSRMTLKKLER